MSSDEKKHVDKTNITRHKLEKPQDVQLNPKMKSKTETTVSHRSSPLESIPEVDDTTASRSGSMDFNDGAEELENETAASAAEIQEVILKEEEEPMEKTLKTSLMSDVDTPSTSTANNEEKLVSGTEEGTQAQESNPDADSASGVTQDPEANDHERSSSPGLATASASGSASGSSQSLTDMSKERTDYVKILIASVNENIINLLRSDLYNYDEPESPNEHQVSKEEEEYIKSLLERSHAYLANVLREQRLRREARLRGEAVEEEASNSQMVSKSETENKSGTESKSETEKKSETVNRSETESKSEADNISENTDDNTSDPKPEPTNQEPDMVSDELAKFSAISISPTNSEQELQSTNEEGERSSTPNNTDESDSSSSTVECVCGILSKFLG